MQILRILEISWLTIAISLLAIAGYQFFSDDSGAATFMLIGSTIASCMYIVRKKQRTKMEQQKTNDPSVHYH